MYKCPNSSCTECLSYNSSAYWGICTKCDDDFKLINELCFENCPDGVLDSNEDCDDKNKDNFDGCSSTCKKEDFWECTGEPSECQPICGD